jgi:hypothetical protein
LNAEATAGPDLRPLQRWALYPALFVSAAILGLFARSAASIESLPRPLVAAVGVTILVQLVLSIVLRSRFTGAYLTACIGLAMLDWPILATLLAAVPVSFAFATRMVRHGGSAFPWSRATAFLNLVGVLLLVLSIAAAWSSGTLATRSLPAVAAKAGPGPDIYLILLDGHPRGDTMHEDFGVDSEAFLGPLERIGFDVSERARSNYNLTSLTLASMFNMEQVQSIPALDSGQSPVNQQRALTKAINAGSALGEFRARGYEIVTVPSPVEELTLYSADRVLDDGSITEFELSVLQAGITPLLLPDVQRTLVMDSLRGRVLDSLIKTVEVARTVSDRPRLVFTHVMSPHAPVLFDADGSPVEGWPCYPTCSAIDFGWRYGSAAIEPLAGQIEYLDSRVVDTVKGIIDASPEPPVIIVFSDHGARHDLDDREEMLCSLLVAFTPGRSGVFPADTTLVNIFPRLLNAYFDARLPLAPERGYTTDLTQLHTNGPLSLEPVYPKIGRWRDRWSRP